MLILVSIDRKLESQQRYSKINRPTGWWISGIRDKWMINEPEQDHNRIKDKDLTYYKKLFAITRMQHLEMGTWQPTINGERNVPSTNISQADWFHYGWSMLCITLQDRWNITRGLVLESWDGESEQRGSPRTMYGVDALKVMSWSYMDHGWRQSWRSWILDPCFFFLDLLGKMLWSDYCSPHFQLRSYQVKWWW